jgi:hypothetical protein
VVLEKIPGVSWHRADPEMRVIPESKIIIAVIIGNCSKIIMIGNTHKKEEEAKKCHDEIWNIFFFQ